MYNPVDGHSAYWLQGTLEKRLDKYSVARASKFRKNRFRVNKLKIINYWGKKGTIPDAVAVNLSKNTVWTLGNEIELSTTEEVELRAFEEEEKYDITDEEDRTTDKPTEDEETRAGSTSIGHPNPWRKAVTEEADSHLSDIINKTR